MTIDEAKAFVDREISTIEQENPAGELRPWMGYACGVVLVKTGSALAFRGVPNPIAFLYSNTIKKWG